MLLFFILHLFAVTPKGFGYQTRNLADIPCGQQQRQQQRGLGRGSRIVGGENAARGEFPWLVSIKRRGGHFCGGSIINRRWVLTAAHCLCSGTNPIQATQIEVGVGEYDLRNAESDQTTAIHVKSIHLHPDYTCARFVHDIALLELDDDVIWNAIVGPACLPIGGAGSYSNQEATAAGWGWTNEHHGKGKRADILQKVTVTVVDNSQCQDWYRSQGKKVNISDSQICAGEENGGKDACWADSGGPLMINNGDGMTVVGLVSTGIGCGQRRLPGLYTRLTDYMPWLLKMIN